VLEFLEGIDLARLVDRRGPLPVADACEAVRQAALGLQHAHEKGVVHRDVKPSNLMATPDGCVKVLDFGLARWDRDRQEEEPASGALTSAGETLGTADYMAPEQWRASRVDVRADVYSLGCTLYHLLTGRPPFAGPGYDTRGEKMLAHAHAPAPPAREQRPEVPGGLAPVLDRLLAKEPAGRFATAAEVAAALQPFCAGCDLPGLLASTGATPPLPWGPAAPAPGGPPEPRRPRPHRGTAPARWAAGALVLVASGLALGLAGRRAFSPPGPVRVDELAVDHYHAEGGEMHPAGTIGLGPSLTTRRGDGVRVRVRISPPGYPYLIAYNADGQDHLCYPEGGATPPPRVKEFVYPPGDDQYFSLTEGVGTQAFVVVVSRKPLPPYGQWRVDTWERVPEGGVWGYDGRRFEPGGSRRGVRGFPGLPEPFKEVCRALKDRPGVEAIRGLAFPVQP
jgi:hypothetical protein